jgi:hypothetical protein
MTQIASPVSARGIGEYFSVNVSLGSPFEPIITLFIVFALELCGAMLLARLDQCHIAKMERAPATDQPRAF